MSNPATQKRVVCKHKKTIKEYDGEYARWVCANEDCDLTGHWFKDPVKRRPHDGRDL